MRRIIVSSLTSALGVKNLDALGIKTNGNDDTLELDDETKLDTALGDNLTGVAKLFTDSTQGLAAKFAAYIEKTTGDDGTLIAHQKTLTDSVTKINEQIAQLERILQEQKEAMTAKFLAMEQASAKSTQQLQFLQKNLGSS
jgi:flagellar hook-associated protein 2